MDEACGTVIHQWSCLIGCLLAGLVISIVRTLVNVTEAREKREGPAVSATPLIFLFPSDLLCLWSSRIKFIYIMPQLAYFFIHFDLKLIITKLVNVSNICNLWHGKCCTYCYSSCRLRIVLQAKHILKRKKKG